MGKTIVMVHGANCGGWCFDEFRKVFEKCGFTCHAPGLIGHGAEKETGRGALASVGMADYRAQMTAFVNALPEKPFLLGHSMARSLPSSSPPMALPRSLSWRARRPAPASCRPRILRSSSARIL
jgi:pimeloyl-ACP methyl ester carboxylesterase